MDIAVDNDGRRRMAGGRSSEKKIWQDGQMGGMTDEGEYGPGRQGSGTLLVNYSTVFDAPSRMTGDTLNYGTNEPVSQSCLTDVNNNWVLRRADAESEIAHCASRSSAVGV
uniref:Outer membrane protein n=1 Tax=Angiostrongylus cantonensis TaxID=6313 RepID=A0A0K0CWW0_ANGCA